MLLATEQDYQNGSVYTRYPPPDDVYRKRARLFRFFPEPILVVGCGFGGLVKAFQELGKASWGVDASSFMVENRVCDRIFHYSILDLANWKVMGTSEAIITEDLLPCLTDEETTLASRNCQALAPIVVHMVTERGTASNLNYHSTGYWMSLINQPALSLEGI